MLLMKVLLIRECNKSKVVLMINKNPHEYSTDHVDFAELNRQINEAWRKAVGSKPRGRRKTINNITIQCELKVQMPALGCEYIRGRKVWRFLDKTILGNEYFYPAGVYGGNILQ